MRRTPRVTRALTVSLAVAAAACQDAGPPSAPNGDPIPQAAAQAPDPDALARVIPGFGGYFVRDGVPTVYLTDVRERPAAEAALDRFARGLAVVRGQVKVLPGRFSWHQLQGWFQRVSPEVLADDGIVFVDLDETANQLLVGVEHGAKAVWVRGVAARLGLPDGAVAVREVEPIRYAATLRDQVRPAVGGLQINFGNFLCTLGFNATAGSQASFITNSHCTDRQGGVEGTLYYQSLASQANSFIGTEVADPQYFRGGECPRGKKCRRSDASRASYAGGVSFTLGRIASTSGPNNSSLTITGSFTITAEGNAVVGQPVNKIGRTTGWTQGTVTNTCVNTGVSGTNIVQLCQTFVSAGVGGGDSGSNVFMLSGGNATLVGILWGGNSSGTQFVYSPIANIEQELGALTTF